MIAAEVAESGFSVQWGALGLAFVLLALNGFFVAAEFALLAARRSRIEQLAADGNKRAVSALAGIRELTLMLAGAQLGITMCSLGLGAVAEPAIAHIIEAALGELIDLSETTLHVIGFTLGLSLVVFLHMVVGEMAPKSWAISDPERSSLLLARPFRAFVRVFQPIIWLLNSLANVVVRLVGVEPQDERAMAHSPTDLILLLDESAGHGDIKAEDHQLLTRSLELSGLTAADAMTVRRDIVSMPAEATAAEVAAEAHRTGRTRIVIHENDLDHCLGFIHAKDLLRLENGAWTTTSARSMVRPLMVTPEHHRLEDLLVEMRTERKHISVAVDEHGVVVGLVTLEDVFEELIGDFDDESDDRLSDCAQHADGSWRVNGTLRPDQLEECTGVALPEGDWQTVAGYVIDALDEIPAAGDSVRTALGDFTVIEMDGYAIATLRIKLND
ncbi:hemolysin family protein [Ilumatobacter sp.]|uniref:hemolysin family protein n=1 Tax=Ilumatobacter sp. TaxID=1967498 RepID=UPI0037505EAC|nr:HlyC/CorC family transporter [Ilumatobacter sp.]